MCGRMNISDHEGIREFLANLELPLQWSVPNLDETQKFAASYNVAPASKVKVLYALDKKIQQKVMQWGIKPSWQANKKNKLPNMLMYARAETAWQKKSFSSLIASQRIVIPVNGFYEWRRDPGKKQPFYFSSNDAVIFLAGLFTVTGEGEYQCCVLTNKPGDLMAPVHHRSPVIIDGKSLQTWLCNNEVEVLNRIMNNSNENLLHVIEVSSYVNNTRHEGEVCIQPKASASEPEQTRLF